MCTTCGLSTWGGQKSVGSPGTEPWVWTVVEQVCWNWELKLSLLQEQLSLPTKPTTQAPGHFFICYSTPLHFPRGRGNESTGWFPQETSSNAHWSHDLHLCSIPTLASTPHLWPAITCWLSQTGRSLMLLTWTSTSLRYSQRIKHISRTQQIPIRRKDLYNQSSNKKACLYIQFLTKSETSFLSVLKLSTFKYFSQYS